ncbi:MAG: proton-conducting transporter membrane subunit [Desulfobacteraceae bacterium]|nr:proton-conducting transporter membrane subunit [Desulfobacteraceae bacterium]
MTTVLISIVLLILSGLAAFTAGRSYKVATLLGAGGAFLACISAMPPVLRILLGGASKPLHLPWDVPYGSFSVAIDPLSAAFLVPILVLSALCALYGAQYLESYSAGKSTGAHWFFFNLLVASMIMVTIARNGVLFLIAWEVMSISPLFLILFEDEKPEVRSAGWTYLVAAHLGAVFILVFFLMLGRNSQSLDFDLLMAQGKGLPLGGGVLFLFAVIGFGAKAGFIPFHVWLPEAHPAAPSHVSALMSGIMIKMGIYGILRSLTLLGRPDPLWGYAMIGIGLSSGILGVIYALAQHDLKRLLAYHSVENIGIIALGIGVGLMGEASGLPVLAALGFGGAIFHVLNHAIFKGLLFLGAGSVLHGAKTAKIDRLGGLLKSMPVTGACFLIGAAAISGLPPLNGFASEFLIYYGAIGASLKGSAAFATPLILTAAGLALIGGLATACFTKAFGVVFLGEPRHEETAHESGILMRIPMLALAGLCAIIGITSPLILNILGPAVRVILSSQGQMAASGLMPATRPLLMISLASTGLIFLTIALVLIRKAILRGRTVTSAPTWGCGYARPTARMQYTASSFAQPLTGLFRPFLRTAETVRMPKDIFPTNAFFESHTNDAFKELIFEPAFLGIARLFSRLKWLQHGRVQLYVLYIAITLMAILFWKLRG